MRYFRIIITFLLVGMCSVLRAQSLSVESFRLLENDLTANTYGSMMRDQNGEVAALIRVVTSEKGFVFDGGMMGIVGTKQDVGEILVYVPHGIQKITIKHDQLGVLRDYFFPIPIEKARTYEMKLLSGRLKTVVDDQLSAQFVIFHVTPSNATVTIDGVPHMAESDGNVTQLLSYGQHEYRVELPGYKTEAGTVNVGSEKITKEIELVSSKAKITLNCSMQEAEIWINEQKYGDGTWTGELAAGMYMVEVKREGYQTRNMAITVKENEERSFTVPEPIPVYGHIQVQSTPLDATVFIDGKEVGKTPHLEGNVRGGQHTVTVKKDGYQDFETSVVVENSKVAEITARMEKENKQSQSQTAATSRRRQAEPAKETPAETAAAAPAAPAAATKPSKNYKPSSFYLGGFAAPGKLFTFGGQVGFYANNFNVEAEYGLHGREIEGYWVSASSKTQSSADSYWYSWKFSNTISARIGVGIGMGKSLRLTPQAGLAITSLESVDDQLFKSVGDNGVKKSFVAGAQGLLKLEWIPSAHVSLYAAPCYTKPIVMGKIAKEMDNNDNSISGCAGGLRFNIGVNLIF